MANERDGRGDFDFLFGKWKIRNSRLARRLDGNDEWQEFEATLEAGPTLGGLGNIDHYRANFPDGKPFEGMTLRIFNPATRLWSIYWADDRRVVLDPPVIGRFRENEGEFLGDDLFEGKPIRVFYHWKVVDRDTAHWDQAFSADGGKTWETNWRMELIRWNR
jgi:hypothetical protein